MSAGFWGGVGDFAQGFGDKLGGYMAGSLWGGITSGNWGGTSKERKNQIHDIRTLRRREYQDMVHSLREAGLNPMLAVGSSPGHASAHQVQQMQLQGGGVGGAGYSSARAAHRQAGVSESTAPSQIGENLASTGLKQDQAKATQLGFANIGLDFEIKQATIDQIRANTATSRALALKHAQDVTTGAASAKRILKEIEQWDEYGPPHASWEKALLELIQQNKPEDISGSGKSLWKKYQEYFEKRDKEGPKAGSLWQPWWKD